MMAPSGGRFENEPYDWWGLSTNGYEDGFLFLLASGTVGQFKKSLGFCETQQPLTSLENGLSAVVGQDLVVAGQPLTGSPDTPVTTRALYLRRLAPKN